MAEAGSGTAPSPAATATVAVSDAELITFGLVMEEAQVTLASALLRAEAAEAELAALADRLGAVIRSAVTAERERIREPVANFLAEYGDSQIPAFTVGQDLANAILKMLGPSSAEAPDA